MDATILDHLTRVVATQGQHALWQDALPWIADACGAAGGRVVVGMTAAVQHQYGAIDDELAEAIDQWEESLLTLEDWLPSGSGSLVSSPPISSTTQHPTLPLIHVPIFESGSIVGGVSLAFPAHRPPTREMVATVGALVQAVASIGTLATDRHQLKRHLTHTNLLYEVSRAITSTLDVSTVLEYTTELAATTLSADASSLMLIDEETEELVFSIPHGQSGGILREYRMPMSEGIAGWVARRGQPLIVNDTAQDPHFTPRVDSHSGFVTRNVICVPLQLRGKTVGVLEVLNKQEGKPFDEEDQDWLTTLAAQAAIAIENARLYSSLREERDRIIRAEEKVRHQLARDLHDGVAQITATIIYNIEILRRLARSQPQVLDAELDQLRQLAQRANQEVRQLLFELRPLILESRGLMGALQAMVSQQARLGCPVELSAEHLPPLSNKEAEGAVFMIIQEAVNNVRKHAQATQTWLRLCAGDAQLVVEIEDNGTGFNLDATRSSYNERGSLGLLSMQERAERLDATLRITSPRPGHEDGTLVILQVPLERLTSNEDGLHSERPEG